MENTNGIFTYRTNLLHNMADGRNIQETRLKILLSFWSR